MSPAPGIPDTLRSLSIRRLDRSAPELCVICELPARWRVATEYAVGDSSQSLSTDLCAIHGYTFVSGLGDSVRAGDP